MVGNPPWHSFLAARLGPAAMTTTGLVIRRAGLEDALPLSRLMTRTFEAAFGTQNDPAHLAEHLARSYSEPRQRSELLDPGIVTLMAEVDGTAAGYAQVRRTGTAPACITGPDPVELWRFYLDQPWIGRGIARDLMAAVRREARALGGRTLWLGVWELNPRGIAFYRKEGFVDVGGQIFHVGPDPQNDRVMARSLETS